MSAAVVPDHTVIRFCERAGGPACRDIHALRRLGVDVEFIRQSIADIVQTSIDNDAPGHTWNNLRFMLRGNVVVTVLTREQYYNRHGHLVSEGHRA